jgi:glycine dehydrogenase subunit 1
MDVVGVQDIEELFVQIPDDHRATPPDLPPALSAEVELSRHLRRTLARNGTCEQYRSFLGGGCWQHHVPAICDELATRTEFVTSEWGTPASDHGRNQAWFEFTSQMGALLDLDFVGLPVYSWGAALGHAIRMAARLTGRTEILVPAALDAERKAVALTYAGTELTLTEVATNAAGRLDLDALDAKLNPDVAAVYLETPNALGVIETEAQEIARRARAAGAETIAGVDPLSLGILAPPGAWGADIAVGSTQPLGVHMHCGGGTGGFIATRDEERYARQYPTLQVSVARTRVAGERGFAMSLFGQTSYGAREDGNDWTGNSVYLWAIVNAAYLSLLGPQGFAELGELILARCHYARTRLAAIPGVSVRYDGAFKELVLDFVKPVAEVNAALRERGIFGGHALDTHTALYCFTEVHATEDIDALAEALTEVLA